jgi:UDP-2,3-diacylglucosamine pyrophosphatase LpxH
VRTLIISDLHLGTRLGRDVLRYEPALAVLRDALADVDRLVLLGDTVELLEGRPRAAMGVAEPVLREIGRVMGSEREVVLLPGNHDRALIGRWLAAHGSAMAPDAAVPTNASAELSAVVSWLSPARVRVQYPGVWLGDGLWATHGHYLDRHLLPEAAYGLARGLLGRLPRDGATPYDYEVGPHVTRLEARMIGRLPVRFSALIDEVAGALRAEAMDGTALTRWLSPVNALALGLQMRHASLPALARVVHRLGVDAHTVVFGHVHRSGPHQADRAARWEGPAGAPRILNSGCWVYEPLLLTRARPPHPYWPGGAVLIDADGPRAVGLLDDVDPAHYRAAR